MGLLAGQPTRHATDHPSADRLQLDALLDTGTRRVLDHATFYALHRAYLLVTAAQWLAALAHAVVATGEWRSEWRSEDLSALAHDSMTPTR